MDEENGRERKRANTKEFLPTLDNEEYQDKLRMLHVEHS